MGINDIELTGEMISLLFGNSLIDCNSEESEREKREILIFTNIKKSAAESENDLLAGMMKACRVDAHGYRTLELDKKSVTGIGKLKSGQQPAGLLFFGGEDELKAAGIDAGHFEQTEKNGIPLLAAPSLSAIAADKKIKMEVWESLKQFFKI